MRPENPVLLRIRQSAEQGKDLDAAPLLALDGFGGLADLALAGEEHQDVAVALAHELAAGADDAVDLVDVRDPGFDLAVLARDGFLDGQRAVADLDRERAAGDLDDRCGRAVGVGEMLREPLRVDGRRGDDDLQVRALGQQPLEVAQQEIDVEAAFVGLVDDDRVVVEQQPVALDLGEQNAVGHELDARVAADAIVETDGVADVAADLLAELVGDALGHRARGKAARLRVADLAQHAAAQVEQDLRDLRGLARTGFAGDDGDLVVLDGLGDVVAAGGDRQRFRVRDSRQGGAAFLDAQPRQLDVLGDGVDGVGCRGALEAAAEAAGLRVRHAVQAGVDGPLVHLGARAPGGLVRPCVGGAAAASLAAAVGAAGVLLLLRHGCRPG